MRKVCIAVKFSLDPFYLRKHVLFFELGQILFFVQVMLRIRRHLGFLFWIACFGGAVLQRAKRKSVQDCKRRESRSRADSSYFGLVFPFGRTHPGVKTTGKIETVMKGNRPKEYDEK